MSEVEFGRPIKILAIVASISLCGAIGSWPYKYYIVVRWVICAISVLFALEGRTQRHSWTILCFIIIAILFNPLAPIHMERTTWHIVDLAAALLFLVSGFVLFDLVKKPNRL